MAALLPRSVDVDDAHILAVLDVLTQAAVHFVVAFRANMCCNAPDSCHQIQPNESISVVFSDTLGTPLSPVYLGLMLGERDPTTVAEVVATPNNAFVRSWAALRERLETAFLWMLVVCDARRAIQPELYRRLTTAVRMLSLVEFRYLDCCCVNGVDLAEI